MTKNFDANDLAQSRVRMRAELMARHAEGRVSALVLIAEVLGVLDALVSAEADRDLAEPVLAASEAFVDAESGSTLEAERYLVLSDAVAARRAESWRRDALLRLRDSVRK